MSGDSAAALMGKSPQHGKKLSLISRFWDGQMLKLKLIASRTLHHIKYSFSYYKTCLNSDENGFDFNKIA